jgi:hypothetical protein
MTATTNLQEIAAALPILNEPEQKERFLFVLGALTARIISLRKAAEVINLNEDALLQTLDLLGIDFFYLSQEDIEQEMMEWKS